MKWNNQKMRVHDNYNIIAKIILFKDEVQEVENIFKTKNNLKHVRKHYINILKIWKIREFQHPFNNSEKAKKIEKRIFRNFESQK